MALTPEEIEASRARADQLAAPLTDDEKAQIRAAYEAGEEPYKTVIDSVVALTGLDLEDVFAIV